MISHTQWILTRPKCHRKERPNSMEALKIYRKAAANSWSNFSPSAESPATETFSIREHISVAGMQCNVACDVPSNRLSLPAVAPERQFFNGRKDIMRAFAGLYRRSTTQKKVKSLVGEALAAFRRSKNYLWNGICIFFVLATCLRLWSQSFCLISRDELGIIEDLQTHKSCINKFSALLHT